MQKNLKTIGTYTESTDLIFLSPSKNDSSRDTVLLSKELSAEVCPQKYTVYLRSEKHYNYILLRNISLHLPYALDMYLSVSYTAVLRTSVRMWNNELHTTTYTSHTQ